MSLIDSLRFHLSFFISTIPITLNIIKFLLFSTLHTVLGTDPRSRSTYPSLASLPLPGVERKPPCPYANNWGGKEDEKEEEEDADARRREVEHPYTPPTKDDSRSPCPALNAMANHGYIPHDGRNLTGTLLTHALMDAYALSWPLAAFLAWGGVLLLGQVGTLSLSDLARHNRIEHDASLTHANTLPSEEYAPIRSDEGLYEKLLGDAREESFTATDIARARKRREAEPGTQVTAVQQEIARGEVALVLQIFGGSTFAVPVDVVHSWWKEEKFPEGWRPYRTTTLLGTVYWSSVIRHAMERMRSGEQKEMLTVVEEKKTVTINGTEFDQMTRSKKNSSVAYPSSHILETSESTASETTLYSRESNHSRDTTKSDYDSASAGSSPLISPSETSTLVSESRIRTRTSEGKERDGYLSNTVENIHVIGAA